MEASRLFINIFLIVCIASTFLCGCDVDELQGVAEDAYEEIKTPKEDKIDVDNLLAELTTDLMKKDNDSIIKYFSEDTIEKYGEDHIRARLDEAEELIKGEYISEEAETTGGVGTRGGKGVDISDYEITLKTDEDTYSICISWSNGDSTNGYFTEDYKSSMNLMYIAVFPYSVMYDENGDYNYEYAGEISNSDSCICYPGGE